MPTPAAAIQLARRCGSDVGGTRWRAVPLALSVATTLMAFISALPAQDPQPAASVADTAPRLVEGRVLRATIAEPRPVAGIWVVLHRVGSDTAGPLDSTRSRADGSYQIRYRLSGSETAIYFVSADYAGIAYFSAPLRDPVVLGEAAELYVFDTTSAPVPVRVLGRHLVVSAPGVGRHREIVEVYELANDTTVTRVSGGPTAPAFSALLPDRAVNFQAGQGDFSPGALVMQDGRLASHAPIAPGLKQLSFSYTLPADAFPLSVPIDRAVEVLEVLLEESAADAQAPGLVEVSPVSIEQRTFRRFLAQQMPANAVITLTAPAPPSRQLAPTYVITIALVAGGVMAIVLLVAFVAGRRRLVTVGLPAAAASVSPAPTPDAAGALAREVAELDERFERRAETTDVERATYQARRAELKRRLADALATRPGDG